MDHAAKTSKSNVLPACIIAVGIIVAAIIIAKPKAPFQLASIFPPVSIDSVKQQVASQLQTQLSGRQVKIWSGAKVRLQHLEIESVNYDVERNKYTVRYNLHWNNAGRSVLGTGCFLSSNGSNSFSGDCNIGEDQKRNGALYPVTVLISVH